MKEIKLVVVLGENDWDEHEGILEVDWDVLYAFVKIH